MSTLLHLSDGDTVLRMNGVESRGLSLPTLTAFYSLLVDHSTGSVRSYQDKVPDLSH